MDVTKQFKEMVIYAGAIDVPRVVASGKLAITNGDDPAYVLDCLVRNRPEFFSHVKKRAAQRRLSRQKKMSVV